MVHSQRSLIRLVLFGQVFIRAMHISNEQYVAHDCLIRESRQGPLFAVSADLEGRTKVAAFRSMTPIMRNFLEQIVKERTRFVDGGDIGEHACTAINFVKGLSLTFTVQNIKKIDPNEVSATLCSYKENSLNVDDLLELLAFTNAAQD